MGLTKKGVIIRGSSGRLTIGMLESSEFRTWHLFFLSRLFVFFFCLWKL